jgi:hypothetical protein
MGMTPDRATADPFRFDATVADVVSSGDCKIAADRDGDGTMDVVLSSSQGTADLRRVVVWRNNGKGAFERHEVWREREGHLGTRAHDLDGDLDIVRIGCDGGDHAWPWRNDAIAIEGLNGRVEHAASAQPERPRYSRQIRFLAGIVN